MKERKHSDRDRKSSGTQGIDRKSDAYVVGNLAVQSSLMEIFDEFTDVISGELKSMNLSDEKNAQGGPGNSV